MDFETIRILAERFGYIFLFAGAFIDGFHVMLVGGFLAGAKYINLWWALLALFLGNFLSDLLWYGLAYIGGDKTINWLSRYNPRLPLYMKKTRILLEKYAGRILITVKLTLGLSLATVLSAGATRMSFRKFFLYDLVGSIGIVLEVTLVGFLLGESYKRANEYFTALGVGVIILSAILLITLTIYNRHRILNIKE